MSKELNLDPSIWGPHFWFVMHTVAIKYPNKPNDTFKKTTYKFFNDLKHFLPNNEMQKTYSQMLNDYPLTPYLDTRLSLIKWVNFIHNKYNASLGKEQIELYRGLEMYHDKYKPEEYQSFKIKKHREKYLMIGICCALLILGLYIYEV